MIHRYRRRWLKRNLRPCPNNCQLAEMLGRRVLGCTGCGSSNPDQCTKEPKFVPLYTKEELHQQFRERIRNQEILLRDYRDIAALLWAMGGFDDELDEGLLAGIEQREKPGDQTTPTTLAPPRPAPPKVIRRPKVEVPPPVEREEVNGNK